MALFKFLGIVLVDKDKFTNLVITGNMVSKHSFNNHVSIPSSSHDFDADLATIILISSGVASENSGTGVSFGSYLQRIAYRVLQGCHVLVRLELHFSWLTYWQFLKVPFSLMHFEG